MSNQEDKYEVCWQNVIDALCRWQYNLHRYVDDADLPSEEAYASALAHCQRWQLLGWKIPSSLVPWDGSICFEWINGDRTATIEMRRDGTVERTDFRDGKLITA